MIKMNSFDVREIDIEELEEFKRQNKNFVLLDVRSMQEYEERHLEGSVSMPYYDINEGFCSFIPNKEEMIVVYCSHGIRSKKAARALHGLGYTNVFSIKNGIGF